MAAEPSETANAPVPSPESQNTAATAAPTAEAQAKGELELKLPSSAADGLIQKPFPKPLNTTHIPAPEPLTEQQQGLYNQVLKEVSKWSTIPTTSKKNAPTAPITDDERLWLTRECLIRYLRAVKWDDKKKKDKQKVDEAVARLQSTLTWRREYGLEKLTADYISIENETGKQIILGYDINGRPCHYLCPSKQNTEKSDRQIQHLVFMLERVIDLMVPDQETLALVVDFNQASSDQNASPTQAYQTLQILQNHYPERLGRALVINMPSWLSWFFKAISRWIDPVTKEKMKFNEDLRQHVPADHLMKTMGGDVEFQYDHATYWPALIKLAESRRNGYYERWIQGGKRIGEYENYLRGGSQPSLSQTQGDSGEKS